MMISFLVALYFTVLFCIYILYLQWLGNKQVLTLNLPLNLTLKG